VTVAVEVDVRDLVGRPGSSRELRLEQPIEGGMAIELAAVPADRPVQAELLLESVVEGILASGSVSGEMDLSCARCLRPIGHGFELAVSEMFVEPERAEPDEDYLLPETGVIDIEPMLRDAVVLSMPFSPLCRPDCKGLCPRCGGDRNLDECRCEPELADERWDVLSRIEFPDES
jgi:uncharacterized protein